MAIKKIESNIDVLTAAKQRIRNIWKSAPKLYIAFSSGKDSLCLSNLVYTMIQEGEIDGSKLTVYFIDEEGLYKSMEQAALRWRKKFMSIGVKFLWYCLPFKQVCTLDSLSCAESWITWEPGKEDVWMRQPPPFAIVKSEYLKWAGQMNYQTFCAKAFADGITLIGLRVCESYTRMFTIARMDADAYNSRKFYPIYDWSDSDVWLYIRQNNLEFPEIYIRLYEAGVKKKDLRLSAFFGDKTTQGLRWVAETDPEFWARIERRMPNAYLVLLYWDSAMFARQTEKRSHMEETDTSDYKALCEDLLFRNTTKYRINHDTLKTLGTWRRLFIKSVGMATQKHYKKMYESIINGDPKQRDLRTLLNTIYTDYAEDVKHGRRNEPVSAAVDASVGRQKPAESE